MQKPKGPPAADDAAGLQRLSPPLMMGKACRFSAKNAPRLGRSPRPRRLVRGFGWPRSRRPFRKPRRFGQTTNSPYFRRGARAPGCRPIRRPAARLDKGAEVDRADKSGIVHARYYPVSGGVSAIRAVASASESESE